MPIKEFGETRKYKAKVDLPTSLAHKPIFAIPYLQFDGMYADNSDCQYLSIGLAQWDNESVSMKTMRFSNGKWSRQSEELPLHRVIDSTSFLAKVLFDNNDNIVEIERKTFINQNSAIQVESENINKDKFDKFLTHNDDLLKERFNSLYNILDTLKKQGKF